MLVTLLFNLNCVAVTLPAKVAFCEVSIVNAVVLAVAKNKGSLEIDPSEKPSPAPPPVIS